MRLLIACLIGLLTTFGCREAPDARLQVQHESAPLQAAPAIVVVNGRGVTYLSTNASVTFSTDAPVSCSGIGINHRIAIDVKRERIYLLEARDRVTVRGLNGEVVSRFDAKDAKAIALDPQDGNLWCLTGSSLGKGETAVFDPAGRQLVSFPFHGYDIAYDMNDETFWIVGADIEKVDRDGNILFEIPRTGWARVSVAPYRDGGAWVVEREHRNVPGSVDRVMYVNSTGRVVAEKNLVNSNPIGVACDLKTGVAWVVDSRKRLLRFPLKGASLKPIPIPARAIAIHPDTGDVWVATELDIVSFDSSGRRLRSFTFDCFSAGARVAAF